MQTATAEIIYKFQELRAKTALIFDASKLHYKFMKQELFEEEFTPFYERIEAEIRSLPENPTTFDEIDEFVSALSRGIMRVKKKDKLTEIDTLHLRYRRKLKAKLLEIKSSLSRENSGNTAENQQATTDALREAESAPLLFRDIFTSPDWEIYIRVLAKVANPVISTQYMFTGKSQRHKGVICSWIKELQAKGVISNQYNRQQLASVLNREIKDLNLGKDGKTFDNVSLVYENQYRNSFLRLSNLVP